MFTMIACNVKRLGGVVIRVAFVAKSNIRTCFGSCAVQFGHTHKFNLRRTVGKLSLSFRSL